MSWLPVIVATAVTSLFFARRRRLSPAGSGPSPLPPKGVRCSPPSTHQLDYVAKKGDSYGTIAKAITGSTVMQIDLAAANPEVELDFQFASTDHPGTVIHSDKADPIPQQDGGLAPFLGAFPAPGTTLKIPLSWNGHVFFSEDGKTWHSDGDGVSYPACSTGGA